MVHVLCVLVIIITVSPAKMAELIGMLFEGEGRLTWVHFDKRYVYATASGDAGSCYHKLILNVLPRILLMPSRPQSYFRIHGHRRKR